MIGIDAEILVSYLTQNNLNYANLAEQLIKQNTENKNKIMINNIVICDVVLILDKKYKYTKEQIVRVLRSIFSTSEFLFEKQHILWEALDDYERLDIAFPIVLISKLNKSYNADVTYTFNETKSQSNNLKILKLS